MALPATYLVRQDQAERFCEEASWLTTGDPTGITIYLRSMDRVLAFDVILPYDFELIS
jgi:hypothetical protein